MLRVSVVMFSVLLLEGMSLGAACGEAPKYPLRVRVNKAQYGCSNCSTIYPIQSNPPGRFRVDPEAVADSPYEAPLGEGPPSDPERHYAGQGSGVLLLNANKTQRFWFAYSGCLDPLPISHTASLAARWRKADKELEVLVPKYSPHKPVDFQTKHLSVCVVDISLKGPIAKARTSAR